ncbi:tyrosine-type recombinase/integrase [Sphaerisporangium sp. NPDC005288]|uniref:site-specific integrase n=1 Tax=Sphaerisporangium sp. NPDC005288 TaxID=3155114 RepID=UPI0033B1A489
MSDGRSGSIKLDKNGTYYFVVDITPPGVKPRKQTRRRGFKTKRAAQAELTSILTSLAEQTYVAPKNQTLGEFLTATWLPAIEHTIRRSTFESYARNVRLHIAGRAIGNRKLQSIEGGHLNHLYALLLAGEDGHRPLGRRSTYYIHTIIHRSLKDAVRWKAIVRNPADDADPPKSQKPEMQTWKAADVRAFLAGAAEHRLYGGFALLLGTGMRRGELLGLKWDDIDFEGGRLHIRRALITVDARRKDSPGMAWSEPKTAKGRRTVALDETSLRALREHRKRQAAEKLALGPGYADEGLVFCRVDGGPLHPKTFSYHWDHTVKRLKLPRLTVHGARHTWATLALRAGISPRIVQERIGHANVAITLGTYSHVDIEMQADAAARVAALVAGDEK